MSRLHSDVWALHERLLHFAAAKSPRSYCPHEPHPKQREFLQLDCLEALYGGAAGGGKSDALLMAALQHVHVPGYAALLLRRTYADLSLPGAIMDRAHSWLAGTSAVWNGQDKRWSFPSGATLTFGYLDNEKDRYRYQGAELQFIGFDELTQFPEVWYRYLLSRLRRLQGANVPLRARSASNPGGLGHDWVRRRFVAAGDNERRFVPATLEDNPSIDAGSYRLSLSQLDATTRKQLEEGIWVRDSGGLVYQFEEARNIVAQAPKCEDHILGIDYGYTDSTAFVVLGWRANDPTVYVVESFKETGMTPSAAAQVVHTLEKHYKFAQIVGDTGGLGKGYAEEARARFGLPIVAAEKHNKRGYIDLLNGDLCEARLKISKANTGLIAEMLELPWDKERKAPEPGFEDHLCDALLYGWRSCRAFLAVPPEAKAVYGTPEYWREHEAKMVEAAEAELRKQEREEEW